MRLLNRVISQLASLNTSSTSTNPLRTIKNLSALSTYRLFSTDGSGTGGFDDDTDWGSPFSSWSTGLTKEHFDGKAVGRQINEGEPARSGTGAGTGTGTMNENSRFTEDARWTDQEMEYLKRLKESYDQQNRASKAFLDDEKKRMIETNVLIKQVQEPGARGSYLKDSEKAEMYRLHKENPEVYTVERLAKDYRIMRQRVHAILWLKEDEEEEEKKRGPLDDSIELLLDNFPEFFTSHDREFHVATLPYKPEFKVMPEGWDGTTRDPDEVHYEISKMEDEWLYQDFVRRMNFNKMKIAGQVKCHKYSRRRPPQGWKITIEKMGKRGKRGKNGGGWKFVSLPDGSTRPLNELETMFVKRETPRRRRKILPG